MRVDRTPRFVGVILGWPWTMTLARIALASAYLVGGATKLLDFPGAVAEQAHFGLRPAPLWAALTIIVELGAGAFFVAGRFVWLSAGALGFDGPTANSLDSVSDRGCSRSIS